MLHRPGGSSSALYKVSVMSSVKDVWRVLITCVDKDVELAVGHLRETFIS